MALTQVQAGILGSDSQYTGFKNRIINGAMMIDQRNAGASVTPANGTYTLDRWLVGVDQTGKFSVQQSSTAPTGFVNSMVCTSLSAYTPGTNEAFQMRQNIEGLNVSDLAWGTASAATVALSFWVRSSLTGTFGGSVNNNGYDRSYVFSYTINSANTWEYKTVTIPGDQTGTWLTTNGVGIRLGFGLGAASGKSTTAGSWGAGFYAQPTGSVAVVGTNGATFYITGVQLEKGSTATSFDYRPYGVEDILCKRYCLVDTYSAQEQVCFNGFWSTSTGVEAIKFFPVEMRAAPTLTIPTIGAVAALEPQTAWRAASAVTVNEVGTRSAKYFFTCSTNTSWASTGRSNSVVSLKSSGKIIFDSEL
jgi:hypothetical protein